MKTRTRTAAFMLAGIALTAGACGTTTTNTASGGGSTTSSAASGTTAKAGGYTPVSDVAAHAAIGKDFAAIKTELGKTKDNKPIDWAAVKATFTNGSASKKSDGSMRTLATLVDAPEVVASVNSAIDGGNGTDAVRAQRVEKGISALLYLKVIDELVAAEKKIADNKTDPKDGAPHNVDEAWAFYTADGNGLQATATKRGDDFKKPVDQPILSALTAAQAASKSGDAAAFDTAEDQARAALNYIFYLATYKYLDTGGDAVKRAEGESFYLAIAPIIKKAAPDADNAITAAFASGDAKSGRAALNSAPVVGALELKNDQAITN